MDQRNEAAKQMDRESNRFLAGALLIGIGGPIAIAIYFKQAAWLLLWIIAALVFGL